MATPEEIIAQPPASISKVIAGQSAASRFSVRAPEALRATALPGAREKSIHKMAEETIRIFGPRAPQRGDAKTHPVLPQLETMPGMAAQAYSVRELSSQQRSIPLDALSVSEMQTDDKGPAGIRVAEEINEIHQRVKPAPLHVSALTDKPAEETIHEPVHAEIRTEPAANKVRKLEVPISSPRSPVLAPGRTLSEDARRSHISIGKIDVQVNNEGPPQPATPQSARIPVRANSLEQRFLGRFFITL
jgi:hypothetical protein